MLPTGGFTELLLFFGDVILLLLFEIFFCDDEFFGEVCELDFGVLAVVLDDFTVVCFPVLFFFGRFAVVLVGSLASPVGLTLLCRRFFVTCALEGGGITGVILAVELVDPVFWLGGPKF